MIFPMSDDECWKKSQNLFEDTVIDTFKSFVDANNSAENISKVVKNSAKKL